MIKRYIYLAYYKIINLFIYIIIDLVKKDLV